MNTLIKLHDFEVLLCQECCPETLSGLFVLYFSRKRRLKAALWSGMNENREKSCSRRGGSGGDVTGL
jgi:hypothetical protein